MENFIKDGYVFKVIFIDLDIFYDYFCLLNNVFLIGIFFVFFLNNIGKMKKKMIILIKLMKKDL